MSKYLLLMSDEDGNPMRFLEDGKVNNITELMDYYGIERWVENFDNPAYWQDGDAMLLKYEVSNPKAVQVVSEWQL